jgi:dCMP deaminase
MRFRVSNKIMIPEKTTPKRASPAGQTKLDSFFLLKTFAVRQESDDPIANYNVNSGVGAIIVFGGREIAHSANVLPPRLKRRLERSAAGVSPDERYFLIEHAERASIYNALLAGERIEGATIYCSRFPCADCARAIAWVGLAKLVVPTGFSSEKRWLESQKAALRILRSSGVKVRYLRINSGE